MTKVEVFKTVTGTVVAITVGALVCNAIKATTPSDIGKVTKALTMLGSAILIGLIGDAAERYYENLVDSSVENMKKIVDEANKS